MLFGADIFNFVTLLLHLTGSGTFPKPLSVKEEANLVAEKASGSLHARNKLIEHNLRLVAHIVKKYGTQYAEQDDLISIGTIGLIKGVDTFSGKKGVRLATYASRCIENEILMYFRTLKKISCEISLDEPIDSDKDGNSLTLKDIISCNDNVVEKLDTEMKNQKLRNAVITQLSERERTIIEMRYGLCGARSKTQQQVAEKLGISRSYVSRIEKAAMEKLREHGELELFI